MSQLVAFGLTHIRYPEGDTLGLLLAFFALFPIFIHVALIGALLARREIQYLFLLIGLTMNEVLSILLKKLIKGPRPESCAALEMCSSYGMPSSHSQYMAFLAVLLSLDLATHWIRRSQCDVVQKVLCALSWPCMIIVMYGRVYLGYHDELQVVAGATVGIVSAAVW
eukprot:CAMPEP_0196584742 /NCGR_PEP_ID=MMETSP1081-20130531/48306_1 /TAXON_ID=36882 /ORGANISM="Pyramimonas amylifera, Strain CCMP720" /LENGTH=166 /DNA_ID=CAMNT_0041906063 /DNA_START=124 /DNA_END=621 /DNA_ORIENTATION=-